MAHDVRIAPSILSADMAHLARDLERIATADLIHIDVMDGHFTGNLTFGAGVVAACKRSCDVPLDVHMMVTNPDETIDWYLDAGADVITVHTEASTHLHRTVMHIKDRGAQAGVVLNPATPVSVLEDILPELDMVLVMSVNPGFGGQSFIEGTYAKLERLTELCARVGAHPSIEVDGGISAKNIERVASLGADTFVAGSAVFGAADPAAEIARLRELACAAKNSGAAR
ncbi:ribulose-phosphate 3-epimerase [Enorma burkinafasonensis]|uniref:ribulose-phosphate 3-epimerase n=1 Tax=Enorma burkinafasonensis TaxID=2590867 RepID=UPI0026EEF625|nr:ribulose-phosphate 3-epimerase [Enorma burkinafasonensis]MCI7731063.1 ribulose-phosphate 3-epimerase [Enorma burkinafasonensis]